MRYIVEWDDDVVREYQAIQKVAVDPGAIYRAVEAIDEQLQEDAETKGESRPDGARIIFARPVGVLFHVVGRKVFVFAIWRTDRPPSQPPSDGATEV